MQTNVTVDSVEGTLTIELVVALEEDLATRIATEIERLNESPQARLYGVKFDAGNVVRKAIIDGLAGGPPAPTIMAPQPAQPSQPVLAVQHVQPAPPPPAPVGLPRASRADPQSPAPPIQTGRPGRRRGPVPETLPNGVKHPLAGMPELESERGVATLLKGEEGDDARIQSVVTADPKYVHMSVPIDFTLWDPMDPLTDSLYEAFDYYEALNEGQPRGFGWLPYRMRVVDEAAASVSIYLAFWSNRLCDQAPNGNQVAPFEGFTSEALGGARPGSSKGVIHTKLIGGDVV